MLNNKQKLVLLVTIDEATIVPFIVNTVQNVPLAVALSTRANLKGAESLFTGQFQRLFQSGQYKEAAIIAASSPGTVLRNAQTIQLFQQVSKIFSLPFFFFFFFAQIKQHFFLKITFQFSFHLCLVNRRHCCSTLAHCSRRAS